MAAQVGEERPMEGVLFTFGAISMPDDPDG